MEDKKGTVGLEPAQLQERMQVMDILRGIALLGIFIFNAYYLSSIGFLSESQKASFPSAKIDHWVHFFVSFLIEGKFYSIFSLLFGAGFGILLVKAQQKGISFKKYYTKRLLILLGIGLIHLFVIWPGDILTIYAGLGFLLIFFLNAEVKTLWKWSIALLLSPILIFSFIYFTGGINPGIPFFMLSQWLELILFPSSDFDIAQIIASGSIWDTVKFNFIYGFIRIGDLLYSSRLPRVFGMFLIGFIFVKKGIFKNPDMHLGFLKKCFVIGVAIGLPGSLAMAIMAEYGSIYDLSSTVGIWENVFYSIGVHTLAIGYIAGILLLSLNGKATRFLNLFAPAGRMALTNYLAQTAFGIFFFYGIGLGYAGQLGYALAVVVVVLFFTIQVIYSHIWFSYFYFGPAEWAWRSLLLGKKQNFIIPERKLPVTPSA